VPFAALSVVLAIATIYFAAGETILVSFHDFPLYKRIVLAGNALVEYGKMSLYPVGIIHLYLLPRVFPVSYYVSTGVSIIFTGFCIYNYKRNPWVLATWIAFILPLLPVLGFLQNGAQSYAARFTYLPSVAPGVAAAAIIAMAYKKTLTHRYLPVLFAGLIAVMLAFYVFMTDRLIGAWKNPETLWSRSIAIQPVGRAYYYRADYRLRTGQYLAAADDLALSIEMGKRAGYPGIFNLHALRGDAFSKAGRHEEAVREFTEAIRLNPHPNYFYHRGRALEALGKTKEAQADFLQAGDEIGPVEWRSFQ
jgi:protein O-mannosyl-transferase